MRRFVLAVLMINLVLLCGCGSTARDEEGIQVLRTQLDSCSGLSFQMSLTADDSTYVADYSLRCVWQEEEMCMTLLAPELISGVTARVRDGSAVLEYDTLSLDAGAIDDDGLSPISVPAVVLDALRHGAVTQLRREEIQQTETVAFRVLCSESQCVDFWLRAQDFIPLRAELLICERVAAFCEISDWNLEEG